MTGPARKDKHTGSLMAAALGMPQPWQMGLQPPASPVMEQLASLHGMLLWIIGPILLLVLGLLVYVMLRFNARAHPEPTATTHNPALEILWTALPVVILALIAVPSFRLLYAMDRAPPAELTVKVVGHQWYWEYQLPGGRTFNSVVVADDDLKPGQPRLLEVDQALVLPVETVIKLVVTADDVIHSWSVPAFGVKTDAIPGRLNETWVRIDRPGTYYGQCSQLCGMNHGAMPIKVEAVPREQFFATAK